MKIKVKKKQKKQATLRMSPASLIFPHWFAYLACILALAGWAGCPDSGRQGKPSNGGNNNENDNATYYEFKLPMSVPATRDLDILFMVDNSWSMENEQENLKNSVPALTSTLEKMRGGLPNLHIGVISSDLGTGMHTSIRYCEEIGGDRGVLGKVGTVNLAEQCIGSGQLYIVDVEPTGCMINKNPNFNTCSSHSCEQQHCDAAANYYEVLTLYDDAHGCPRCRNYDGELTETLGCMAELGTDGCGFEQQLEATRKALNPQETLENVRFLRDNAFLAVVLITDEDDCSALHPDVIFSPDLTQNNIDSSLGYIHSFRCFEFGVTCDINDRTITGPRTGCVPREDDQAYLHKIKRYTSFIEAIKDPMMTIIAVITGPVPEEIIVQRDSKDRPEVKLSCEDPVNAGEGATPAIRIKAFVEHFNTLYQMNQWAFNSICAFDFSSYLQNIAAKILGSMSEKCPVQPFAGCREGPPGTTCSPCLPDCTVYDIENPNLSEERKMEVVWCGQVCQNGPCTQAYKEECNFDENGFCRCPEGLGPTVIGSERDIYCAPLLYPDGSHESDIDPRLLKIIPKKECIIEDCIGRSSACWYMSGDTWCEFGAAVRIVRGEEPPSAIVTEGGCRLIPIKETLCDDGVDNDDDCLTDEEDPDCQ